VTYIVQPRPQLVISPVSWLASRVILAVVVIALECAIRVVAGAWRAHGRHDHSGQFLPVLVAGGLEVVLYVNVSVFILSQFDINSQEGVSRCATTASTPHPTSSLACQSGPGAGVRTRGFARLQVVELFRW
jgi:hypothetical protein